MLKGRIFNIQRYCTQDGPGIRTVVFLKGCPLRCKWCSNPESQSYKKEIAINKELCKSCGSCIGICPNNAPYDVSRFIDNPDSEIMGTGISIDRSRCRGCGLCVESCPSGAMTLYG